MLWTSGRRVFCRKDVRIEIALTLTSQNDQYYRINKSSRIGVLIAITFNGGLLELIKYDSIPYISCNYKYAHGQKLRSLDEICFLTHLFML